MPVNSMSFEQVATVLNTIVSQATGKAQLTPTDTSSFVALAKVGLETGYDPLMTAISQVLTRSIFSVRPYNRKFKGIFADSQRYGNHVRKLQVIDKPFVEDDRIKLVDGEAIDMYKVRKPEVLQTNFYGESTFSDYVTIYRDQIDVAITGPDEFSRFLGMVTQNMSDKIEQGHESMARAALCNFIGGKAHLSHPYSVVYLLDGYDNETGSTTTAQSIYQPENFVPFVKWLYSFLRSVASLMSERSAAFHQNFTIDGTKKTIMRHTPADRMKFYLNAQIAYDIDSSVLSGVFNDEYMKMMDKEIVNFWQAIANPTKIDVDAGFTADDGTVTHASTKLSNVIGVLFDEEALGYTMVNNWSSTTPFNSAGGYSNIWYHFTDRYWNDFTENGVVLLLDHSA